MVSRWASMAPSPKGTSVMTRFIRIWCAIVPARPSYSWRILRASSTHSSLRKAYWAIVVVLLVLCYSLRPPPRARPPGRADSPYPADRGRRDVLTGPSVDCDGRGAGLASRGLAFRRDRPRDPRCRALHPRRRRAGRAGAARLHGQPPVHAAIGAGPGGGGVHGRPPASPRARDRHRGHDPHALVGLRGGRRGCLPGPGGPVRVRCRGGALDGGNPRLLAGRAPSPRSWG